MAAAPDDGTCNVNVWTHLLYRPEYLFIVPSEKFLIWTIKGGHGQHGKGVPMKPVIIPPILVLFPDSSAYFDFQVRRHSEITPIKQDVQV
jgi:hypothetical protein